MPKEDCKRQVQTTVLSGGFYTQYSIIQYSVVQYSIVYYTIVYTIVYKFAENYGTIQYSILQYLNIFLYSADELQQRVQRSAQERRPRLLAAQVAHRPKPPGHSRGGSTRSAGRDGPRGMSIYKYIQYSIVFQQYYNSIVWCNIVQYLYTLFSHHFTVFYII